MLYNARTVSPIHLACPFMEEKQSFFIAEALLESRGGKSLLKWKSRYLKNTPAKRLYWSESEKALKCAQTSFIHKAKLHDCAAKTKKHLLLN